MYLTENKSSFQEVCRPCTKDIRGKQSTPFPTFPVRRYCLAGAKVRTDNVALPIIYTGSNPSCRRPLFGEAESPGKLEPQSALAALCLFASGWAESRAIFAWT
ncbi:hypothetical protein J6590_093533, partial [Homalodisca vitripennis]